jgi:hypothetical protein
MVMKKMCACMFQNQQLSAHGRERTAYSSNKLCLPRTLLLLSHAMQSADSQRNKNTHLWRVASFQQHFQLRQGHQTALMLQR